MKVGAIISLVLAIGLIGYWAASGMHMGATQTEALVEVHKSCAAAADCGEDNECTDGKCFEWDGEPIKADEWQPEFKLGILDVAGPGTAGLLGLAGLLFFLDRRKKKAAG